MLDVSKLQKGDRLRWQQSNGPREGAVVCKVPPGESAVEAAKRVGVDVLLHGGLASKMVDTETAPFFRVLVDVDGLFYAPGAPQLQDSGELLPKES